MRKCAGKYWHLHRQAKFVSVTDVTVVYRFWIGCQASNFITAKFLTSSALSMPLDKPLTTLRKYHSFLPLPRHSSKPFESAIGFITRGPLPMGPLLLYPAPPNLTPVAQACRELKEWNDIDFKRNIAISFLERKSAEETTSAAGSSTSASGSERPVATFLPLYLEHDQVRLGTAKLVRDVEEVISCQHQATYGVSLEETTIAPNPNPLDTSGTELADVHGPFYKLVGFLKSCKSTEPPLNHANITASPHILPILQLFFFVLEHCRHNRIPEFVLSEYRHWGIFRITGPGSEDGSLSIKYRWLRWDDHSVAVRSAVDGFIFGRSQQDEKEKGESLLALDALNLVRSAGTPACDSSSSNDSKSSVEPKRAPSHNALLLATASASSINQASPTQASKLEVTHSNRSFEDTLNSENERDALYWDKAFTNAERNYDRTCQKGCFTAKDEVSARLFHVRDHADVPLDYSLHGVRPVVKSDIYCDENLETRRITFPHLLFSNSETTFIERAYMSTQFGYPLASSEARVYQALGDLAGRCIPRFRCIVLSNLRRRLNGDGSWTSACCIVTGNFGVLVEVAACAKTMREMGGSACREHIKKAAQASLGEIHRRGWIHGDICVDTVLIAEEGKKVDVQFFGFPYAMPGTKREMEREMKELLYLFRE